MPEDDTDIGSVQDNARERQHERSEHVEDILNGVDGLLDEDKYPTTSEELAVEYADEAIDLPNETESLGSVFDRLVDERFETPAEAREVLYSELTGPADTGDEYSEGRDLERVDDADSEDVTDSGASDV
ncbi:DUF5789 family protein [Halobacterium jilantaiense]|uniref:DUF2795 domain-containing protein n=1 Tax=Halobacterium jilantaiense TaxID=355548 RepID=A0A1I0QEE2_9EURY|nr:hypothetical protein [Halobacterium jilantaiense]SEW25191.1 hypothetical protein SAMN04487945_2513 [Halobacterium jilantaiense]